MVFAGQSQDCVNLFAGESPVSSNLFAGESLQKSPYEKTDAVLGLTRKKPCESSYYLPFLDLTSYLWIKNLLSYHLRSGKVPVFSFEYKQRAGVIKYFRQIPVSKNSTFQRGSTKIFVLVIFGYMHCKVRGFTLR